jgi:PAS domain S-box-containing protein
MKNIRHLLLFSHLCLVALMAVVMAGAVVNFLSLGKSIDRIFKDNYKSVIAAQQMKEALERLDSAALFHLSGHTDKAREQFSQNRRLFDEAYAIEANNVTEQGEQTIADQIGKKSKEYQQKIERLLTDQEPSSAEARTAYFNSLEPAFRELKSLAQQVLDLNQEAILRADRQAKAEAKRGSIVGITVTVIAFLLALFFSVRIVSASLAPLRSLARQAEEIGEGHLNQRIDLQRTDEIGALATSFNAMSEKLREARKLAEQRLHRAESMSDAALGSLYDPVIVTDAAGKVVHLNRAAEGLFGREEWALGMPILQVTQSAPRIAEAVEKAIHQERVSAAEGEAGFVELQAGEAQRTYRLRATPMRDSDGSLLGATAVLEDVTHLRELDRLKTEFIGVASHELRTPVTSLLLSVKLMEEGAAGELTPSQREIVEAQKQDLVRLEQMTQDLLDVTRLEAGVTPPRFEIVSLPELVENALRLVRAKAEEKGIALAVELPDKPVVVRVDPTLIGRVLVNMLDNAVRHTPSGGRVVVQVAARDKNVVIAVRDTGTGIPAEYLPRIFERFVQVPGATQGGSGLGLSIAQTIVNAHGGEMTVESEVGEGSTFTVTLPDVEVKEETNHGTHPSH